MKMSGIWAAFVAVLVGVPSPAAAAPPDPPAQRSVVRFIDAVSCSSGNAFSDLRRDYYTNVEAAAKDLDALLTACAAWDVVGPGQTLVVVFQVSPTTAAEKSTLARAIVVKAKQSEPGPHWTPGSGLTGVSRAVWLYVTDDTCDNPAVELLVSKKENPVIAQVGALAKLTIPAAGAAAKIDKSSNPALLPPPAPPPPPPPAPPCGLQKESGGYYAHFGRADLITSRSSVTENDYVATVGRTPEGKAANKEGIAVDHLSKAQKIQLTGTATYTNTPLTFLTFHAGAGLFTGRVNGARQMKIDSNMFVSDPASRVVTIAGVAWHRPFDGDSPVTTPRERWGVVTAATLTPGPGALVGLTAGWRGFGFLAGWSVVWLKTGPEGTAEGTAVGQGQTLVWRPADGLVLGATYTFGG